MSEADIVVMRRGDFDEAIARAAKSAADAVASLLSRSSRDSDELWTAEQCAEYLQVQKGTFADKMCHQRGVPSAIVLGDGPKAQRRWVAREIKEWAARRRQSSKNAMSAAVSR